MLTVVMAIGIFGCPAAGRRGEHFFADEQERDGMEDGAAWENSMDRGWLKTEQGLSLSKIRLWQLAGMDNRDFELAGADILCGKGRAQMEGEEIHFPCAEEGILILTAADKAGNCRQVEITYRAQEPTLPVILGAEEGDTLYIPMGHAQDITLDESIKGYDQKDGELPVWADASQVDAEREGEYPVLLWTQDSDGRTAKLYATVKVMDMSLIDNEDKLMLYLLGPEEFKDAEWSDEYREKCFTSDGRLAVRLVDPNAPDEYDIREIEKEIWYTRNPVILFKDPDPGSGEVGMVEKGQRVVLSAVTPDLLGRIQCGNLEGFVFLTELTRKGAGESTGFDGDFDTLSAEEKEEETASPSGKRADPAECFQRINEARASAGVGSLSWDEELAWYASLRLSEVQQTGVTHQRPDGSYPIYGENLYFCSGGADASAAFSGWTQSLSHNENQLDGSWTRGAIVTDGYYWVALFWK